MKIGYFALLGLAAAVAVAPAAMADAVNFLIQRTRDQRHLACSRSEQQSTNSTNPPGNEITGISGTFSDTNVNVSGAITGLATPISYVNLPPVPGFATTSEAVYPTTTCSTRQETRRWSATTLVNGVPTLTYPFSGGLFDIYGVAFNIGGSGGYVGEIWSNGDVGNGPIVYAAGLANATSVVDLPNATPGAGVPPPGGVRFVYSECLCRSPVRRCCSAIGLIGLVAVCARKSKRSSSGEAHS